MKSIREELLEMSLRIATGNEDSNAIGILDYHAGNIREILIENVAMILADNEQEYNNIKAKLYGELPC